MAQIRKLWQQGNSTVISLPTEYLREAGLNIGDCLTVQLHPPGIMVLMPHSRRGRPHPTMTGLKSRKP